MTRIDKRKARKMWKKGEEGFWIVACNLRPEYGMRYRKEWNNQFGGDFDKMVNNFTYENKGKELETFKFAKHNNACGCCVSCT